MKNPRFVLAPLALLAACGPGGGEVATAPRAIIDGALEDGYPAVGALVAQRPEDEQHSSSFCSGTLIDPRWVLTAAHCIDGARNRIPSQGPQSDTYFLHFFMGSDAGAPETGRAVPASRIFVHPGYRAPGGDRFYDIAVFELAEPVTDVTPIPIYRGDLSEQRGVDLFYVGFGQSDGDGNGSGRKRSATLRLDTVNPTAYITAQGDGGVCFGDSGGPGLLDVSGRYEVVGVNSTVFGDPSCYEYSTQVRVDAFASWIDAQMGVGASCDVDPSGCQCEAACGADGVCDNANCGGNSCNNLYTCLRFCRDQRCQLNCIMRATPSTTYVLDEWLSCASERCPGGEQSCVETLCRRESTACEVGLEATIGAADCGHIHRCSSACAEEDLDCQDACFFEATLEAQGQLEVIEACVRAACPDATTREAQRICGAERCRDFLLTCMPDEDCRLAGGSCEASEACVVEPWVATYCLPSAGLEVGAPCTPGAVACADGAICLDDGDGARCLELCATGGDCDVGFAPCAPLEAPGLPFSVGVCSATCPDADRDGACDADDCHPEDPSIHPGAEEVCDAERRDEDCDGARNEGCYTCADGSFATSCPDTSEPAPLPPEPEPEGCACATPSAGAPWAGLLVLLPIAWRRRRLFAGLIASVLVACGGGESAPDASVDAGFVDAGPPDVGFEPWDAGVWPDPSVWRIQQGLVAPGTEVRLEGLVVTSPLGAKGFFVAEGDSGPYLGIWVALEGVDPSALVVEYGDRISLGATVRERAWDPEEADDTTRTRSELVLDDPTDLEVTGEAPLPPASAVTRPELAVADLSERYEGVVVTLDEATVTGNDRDTGRIVLDDLVLVGGLFLPLDLSWLEPGTRFDTMTGPLQFEDGAFFVVPRGEADLVRAPPSFEGCIPDEGYAVCKDGLRWWQARQACGAQGGRLVVLETQEENLAVGGIARRWIEGSFWVGMSDLEEEGVWRWVDGSTLTYSPWGAGEPNDAGNGEDCAHSNWRGDGVWNDLQCSRRQPFVCEFQGEGVRCADDDDCAAGPGTCLDGSCQPE